jgi:outer membrane lipoprotein-sorting protein
MNLRVAKASGVPAHILFYYTEDNLHNNVMIRTMYRAKNIRDNEGNSLIDDYAISEDEKDAFALFLSSAIHEAFNQVMKMTTGVSDALIINEPADDVFDTVPAGLEDTTVVYGFKVKDHEAYNDNNIILVDEGVKSLVETQIMRDWYEMVGNDAEYAKMRAKYNEIKRDLITKRLFQLRKPFMS